MPIVAGIILCSVLVLVVFAAIIIGCVQLLHKLLSSSDNGNKAEEERLLQEINSKLNKLEKRIESLESIVVATDNPRS